MPTRSTSTVLFTIATTLALPAPALADDSTPTAPPTPQENLPPPQSDTDPAPPVAAPEPAFPDGGIVEQAGIGGDTAYGRAGVLELGGSAGLMIAPGFRNVNIAPMVGWFFADNLELSAIMGLSNIKAGSESATVFSALVEPSYHVPFNRSTFGFLGMGFGMAYVTELGGGLAVAPRIGANVMVGRSGVLTPSLSYEYTTHNVKPAGDGMDEKLALVAVSSALRINVGYTAMW
ncbi:MAG: hypothetical protein H0T89_04445 [Deltaproteobacteria bacterium]|nr:hypothetical protein [Deltaproteobacteria bacterium]MDQ3301374.1 hypothetical protein [Myxococcota bacterium]